MLEVQEGRERRKTDIQLIADDMVDEVERVLVRSEVLLRLFKDDVPEEGCSKVYQRVKATVPVLYSVTQFDVLGRSVCRSSEGPQITMRRMEWNERLAAGEQMVMTDAFSSRSTGEWVYAFIGRLTDETGEYAGSVSFAIRIQDLSILPERWRLPEGVEVALANEDGQVLNSRRLTHVDQSWLNEVRDAGAPGLFEVRAKAGERYDVVIANLRPNSAFAVISRPAPGPISEFTLAPLSSFGLPLVAFTVALISAWMLIDRLVLAWLLRLQRRAAAYAAGHYSVRDTRTVEESPRELAELAIAMDHMADGITRRTSSLNEAIHDREMAVREIHHRVKNNLQIVTSFLNLQARQIKDADARAALDTARFRIEALSVVHQTLYQHDRLESVRTGPFFDNLLNQLIDAQGLENRKINLEWSVDDIAVPSDDAIPLALFTVEAVTNATKYAFERAGNIKVTLTQQDGQATLTIEDDGRGADFSEGEERSRGLGRRLMVAFARQLKAEKTVVTSPGKGYRVSLTFPIKPGRNDDHPQQAGASTPAGAHQKDG
ncbi:MAG: histidine kinase dimerization/phosphoacceptor domain -containing protein [Hyphomonadaceae bacterium]